METTGVIGVIMCVDIWMLVVRLLIASTITLLVVAAQAIRVQAMNGTLQQDTRPLPSSNVNDYHDGDERYGGTPISPQRQLQLTLAGQRNVVRRSEEQGNAGLGSGAQTGPQGNNSALTVANDVGVDLPMALHVNEFSSVVLTLPDFYILPTNLSH
ncbi:hypothetical protein BJ165DRAFT_1405841 [Panaeolus papilionaceus]|nr:hypothetical protein BJ165DRAFT_1405841 [Panaeolus papilionaceus]